MLKFLFWPNGAGKELVARQIHANSLRNDGPFIEVNCAAIPSELIDELFGHIKGSFISSQDRTGKFEAANNGTSFLMRLEYERQLSLRF